MKFDINTFEKVAEFGEIEKFEKEVKTPGYPDSEKNTRMVVYKAFGKMWRVARIGTVGWNVCEYDESGKPVRRASSQNLEYFDDEADAHECAKSWVMQFAE